jgi:hypothetical protein
MRTKYTLQELRALGIETVGPNILIGRGPQRRQIRAVAGVVTLDLGALASEIGGQASLMLGATLAALDAPAETPNTLTPVKLKSSKKNTALELS